MVAMIHPAKIPRIITVAHAPFIVSTAIAANAMRASGAKTVVAMTHPIMAAPSGIRQMVEQQSHRNQREAHRETGAHARPKQRADRTAQFHLALGTDGLVNDRCAQRAASSATRFSVLLSAAAGSPSCSVESGSRFSDVIETPSGRL